jgi:WD40 repeat protein
MSQERDHSEFQLRHKVAAIQGELSCISFCPYTSKESGAAIRKRSKPTIKRTLDEVREFQMFAACGGKNVRVYDYPIGEASAIGEKGWDSHDCLGKMELRHVYKSHHEGEDFRVLCFGQHQSTTLSQQQDILCVGGLGANIAIISLKDGKIIKTLWGCTHAIFDLKVCPKTEAQDRNLLCSASKEEIRIWNLDSFACVAIFGGHPDGHAKHFYCVDWHPTGSKIASGGIWHADKDGNVPDGKIAVWNVLHSPSSSNREKREFRATAKFLDEAIMASGVTELQCPKKDPIVRDRHHFNPKCQRFAGASVTGLTGLYTSQQGNHIDCLMWLGDDEEALILSKSVLGNTIVLWKPVSSPRTSKPQHIDYASIIKMFRYEQTFRFESEFLRFDVSHAKETAPATLAVGNNCGEIHVWNLESDWTSSQATQVLSQRKPSRAIKAKTDEIVGMIDAIKDDGSPVNSRQLENEHVRPKENLSFSPADVALTKVESNASDDFKISLLPAKIQPTRTIPPLKNVAESEKDDSFSPSSGKSSEDAIVIDYNEHVFSQGRRKQDAIISIDGVVGNDNTKEPSLTLTGGVGKSMNDPIVLDCDDVTIQHRACASSNTMKASPAGEGIPAEPKGNSTRRLYDETSIVTDDSHHDGKTGESTLQNRKRPAPKVMRTFGSRKAPEETIYTIRQVAFSPDGNTIVACDTGGNIFRWDRRPTRAKTRNELALEFEACNLPEVSLKKVNTPPHNRLKQDEDDDGDDEESDTPLDTPNRQIPCYDDISPNRLGADISECNRTTL